MLHTILPCNRPRPLPYYLAAEEWIALNMPADEYFFAWQVSPTVICGRNQDIAAEVDLNFCDREGIEVYRRRSGGGAVFADNNNIMFSYIAPASAVLSAFSSYTGRVAGALRSLGLDAVASGRNDILVQGRKIAGNAYWQCAERSIVHGTMLYDTDMRMMGGALTPARAKLESHKVTSVESRITTVRSMRPDLSKEAFMQHMLAEICDGTCVLPPEADKEIEALTRQYYDMNFRIHGRYARRATHIAGAGSVLAEVDMHGDKIGSVRLYGDFFEIADLNAALARLEGLSRDAGIIADALGHDDLVAGMNNRQLADIIAKE